MTATASDRDVFLNTGFIRKGLKEITRSAICRIISPLPDLMFCALKYYIMRGRFPDFRYPKTFTDKVQVRKLYDRNPLFPTMVDKADVKALIAERVGPRYIVPTQWVGKDLGSVDWSAITLPVVAKPTHASGVGRLLRSQADVEILMAHDPSAKWLAIDHASYNREWAYSQVEPRIIIETMLLTNGQIPHDYRFFTFDGKVSHIEVNFEVDGQFAYGNYSPRWEKLPFHDPAHHGFYEGKVEQPSRLAEMLRVAEMLGQGLDFVRVDLYACDDWVRVGELTLYPGGGFEAFEPIAYDRLLGEKWALGFALPA